MPVVVSRTGLDLNVAFRTFLGLAYQMRLKNDLGDAGWQVLSNATGDGALKLVSDVVTGSRRFYHVAWLCNLTE